MALIGIVKNKPTRHDWILTRADWPYNTWKCQTCLMVVRSRPANSPFCNQVDVRERSGWESGEEQEFWYPLRKLDSCLPLGYDDVPD